MNNIDRRIKQINIENYIWIIYIILIGLCFYANYYEKNYFCNSDEEAKDKYRKLTIIIFVTAVIIYSYFLYDNYVDYKNTNNDDDELKKLNDLSLLGSFLIFVSGIIFLYIAIVDEELNIELAFN